MAKFMKITLLLFFTCFSLISNAQTEPDRAINNNISDKDWNNVLYGGQPLVTHNVKKVRGTPFVYDTYLKGTVILNDSLRSPENHFKLDAYKNEIWLKKEDGTEIILTHPRVVGLTLQKEGVIHNYRRLVLPSATDRVRKFVELFYAGTITLVKEYQKKFSSADDSSTKVLNGEDEDVFETKEIYYLVDESGSLRRLRLKLDDLYDLFPSLVKKYKSELDAFGKGKSISKNLTETEVISLLNFISELKKK